ncbi:MAG: hypothetical protein Ct9H300mP1_14390 [Planctomycetaceae bacterium]|nr:MAG: hypothetical protein Ct9H300mP1_14390 [Planctomycetaceae bacterium]
MFIGSEGLLLCGFSKRKLLPEAKFKGAKIEVKKVADSPGFYREWTAAIRGGGPATCHFDYSGPLTETVLLGNVAYRAGGGRLRLGPQDADSDGQPPGQRPDQAGLPGRLAGVIHARENSSGFTSP